MPGNRGHNCLTEGFKWPVAVSSSAEGLTITTDRHRTVTRSVADVSVLEIKKFFAPDLVPDPQLLDDQVQIIVVDVGF